MTTETIRNLDEFIKWAEKFKDGEYLFRGVPNACYEIEASAYRRLPDGEKTPKHLLGINLDLIERARRQGHDLKDGHRFSDLELLAELQHFSAATGLVDFTRNASVALWFACWEKLADRQATGKVVVLRSDGYDPLKTVNFKMSNEWEIREFFKPDDHGIYPLYQWEPKSLNNRIVAQQSVFVFGGHRIIEVKGKCHIEVSCKPEIMRQLEEVLGITGNFLFSDFDGFAWLHAQDKPYIESTAKAYRRRGIDTQQRQAENLVENLHETINAFTQSIELDPDNPDSYLHRARAYSQNKQYGKAIKDCKKAIKRYKTAGNNSALLRAYNTLALTYEKQKKYGKAIKFCKKAIKRDPGFAYAYNTLALIYGRKKKFGKVIKFCKKAIKRDPELSYAYSNRGEAWLHKEKWKKARKDLTKAKDMGVNIVMSFQSDYKSGKAFQKKTGLKLPKDIKKMLTKKTQDQ